MAGGHCLWIGWPTQDFDLGEVGDYDPPGSTPGSMYASPPSERTAFGAIEEWPQDVWEDFHDELVRVEQ